MKTTKKEIESIMLGLPKLDCGACGFKTCIDLAEVIVGDEEELKKCIHVSEKPKKNRDREAILELRGEGLGDKLGWKDTLGRDFDFILDCFDNEPGPRETILLYNPALVKELGIKKGDVLIGRPMGMSCGCPVTHCGVATDVDARNGVINWYVTGPLRPRSEGFVDIGYYVSQAYEGIIKESKVKVQLGVRNWFLPRRCMLQWRHSGLVNAVTRMKDGTVKVRVEGLLIG
jgi:uncharacterized Fe-S cluster-containing protein